MLSIQLVERSVDNDKTIEEMVNECPPPGWISVFEKSKPELSLISQTLNRLGPYFPLKKDLFKAFDLCILKDIKVVIVGQDPYHATNNGLPQANGMAFSTNRGTPIQPSLANIYKELENEYPGQFIKPNHGDLNSWADQGILLLNTCLTVAPHVAGSHMDKKKEKGSLWNGFITRVFDGISEVNPGCIFLLWGSISISFAESRLNPRTIKLLSTHPSPLSADKSSKDAPAFMGCGHFLKVNQELAKQGKTLIDWRIQ
jgi:uracil-DNA glycosylase